MNSNAEKRMQWLEQHRWALPLFVFSFGLIVFSFSLPTDYVLSKRGKIIEATITGRASPGKNTVTCAYEVDGVIYRAYAGTPKDITGSSGEYSPSLIGGKVTITYDPLHPETTLDGDMRGRFIEQLCLAILGPAIPAAFLALLLRYGSFEPLKRFMKSVEAKRKRIDDRIKGA